MKRMIYGAAVLVAVSSLVATSAMAAAVVDKKAPAAKAQQRVLATTQAGQQLDPISVAPVLGWENGKPILGKWQAYNKQVTAGPALWPPVMIDAYEGDSSFGNSDLCDNDPTTNFPTNGPLSGGVSPACDFGAGLTGACGNGDTTRWFFGTTWAVSGAITGMSSFADGASNVSNAQAFAWYQAFGSDSAPPCETYFESIVILSVYDNTVASLIDGVQDVDGTTLGNGFVDGIALNFGPIATGGYYFANIDLQLEDPNLHLGIVDNVVVGVPSDGALEILFADGDGAGGAVVGSYGQPMLWAPKNASLQGTFASGIYYYDGDGSGANCAAYDAQYLLADDVVGFGNDPNDPNNGWPGACPEILVPMVALYGGEAAAPCPFTATNVVNGITFSGAPDPDACADDAAYWVLQSTVFAASFSPPAINVEVEGVIPIDGTPAPMLTFCLKGYPTLGGGTAFITVALFNYTTGQFEQVPFVAQPNGPPDVVYCITKDNANNDYVDGQGNVKARITCAKTQAGPVRLHVNTMYFEVQ